MEQITVRQYRTVDTSMLAMVRGHHMKHIGGDKTALAGTDYIRADAGLEFYGSLQDIDKFQFLMPVPWNKPVGIQVQIVKVHLHGKCRRAVAGYLLQIAIHFKIIQLHGYPPVPSGISYIPYILNITGYLVSCKAVYHPSRKPDVTSPNHILT